MQAKSSGLQTMTIITGAHAGKQGIKRTASCAPCTKDQFEQWTRSEGIKIHVAVSAVQRSAIVAAK
jgi:hypothetical protein